eukprot:NODE_308_length_11287_cov_0.209778.p2 type:complete len:417 gc:universal NODE_308_length_11287_cov_0.209778:7555-8805(+)
MSFDGALFTGPPVDRPYNTKLNTCRIQMIPMSGLPHTNYLYSLALTSDPFRLLATGDSNGGVYIWDAFGSINGQQLMSRQQKQGLVDTVNRHGVLVSAFECYEEPKDLQVVSAVQSLAIEKQGIWCLVGTSRGNINLHSVRLRPGAYIHSLHGHSNCVSDIRLSDSQDIAISGDWDGKINVWDLNAGRVVNQFKSSNTQITHLAFQPVSRNSTKNNIFMAVSMDGSIFIYDSRQRNFAAQLQQMETTPPWAISASYSDDGGKILVGRRDNAIEEYIQAQLHKKYKLPSGSGPVSHARYLPNGHAICSSIDNIRIANLVEYDMITNAVSSDTFTTPFEIQSSHHGGPISRMEIDVNHEFLCTGLGVRDWPIDIFSNGIATPFQLNGKAKKPLDTTSGFVNCLLYQVKVKEKLEMRLI